MSQFRNIDGEVRPPTSFEREQLRAMQEAGVVDVFLDPEDTPSAWWETVILLVDDLLRPTDNDWRVWNTEIRYRMGWRPLNLVSTTAFEQMVRESNVTLNNGSSLRLTLSGRLAAMETLLDATGENDEFADRLNERSRWLRVGLRLERTRFVPVKAEHLHESIVQPTLLLLHAERFADVDHLYRKAFERYLQGDHAGAITVATSAVETMLRLGLNEHGGDLGTLCAKAVSTAWIPPGVAETAKKLHAFRSDSDAHTPGTDQAELAMFALHVAGSVLLYLGDTRPSS